MKKKVLSLLLTLAMIVSMMPAMTLTVSAANTYTITMDLKGGILEDGAPDGWIDNEDGTYSKQYPEYSDVYFGLEWTGYEPVSADAPFVGWVNNYGPCLDGYAYLFQDLTFYAEYHQPLQVTLNLCGGILEGEVPDGWINNGDGTYSKSYQKYQSPNIKNEWDGCDILSADSILGEWVDEDGNGMDYIYQLSKDTTLYAKYNPLFNVIIDLKGGTLASEDVPAGWNIVSGESDKYVKRYPLNTRGDDVAGEWENAIPTYPEASGVGFVEYECKDNWYWLESDNSVIEAVVGDLKTVTVNFDGGTVISANPSWTKVSEDSYTKKFPENTVLDTINEELNSTFTVANRSGDRIFLNCYTDNGFFFLDRDNITFTAKFIEGINININSPANGKLYVNGEITSNSTFFVPNDAAITLEQGVLKIERFNDAKYLPIEIVVYGDTGYALDYYTYNGEKIEEYIYSITDNAVISGVCASGTQSYPVWIDGEQFTDESLSKSDGEIIYDPGTQTLTLDGANISSTDNTPISFAQNIKINVISDSTINCAGTGRYVYGIDGGEMKLDITGNGKLSIKFGNKNVQTDITCYGIKARDLNIYSDVQITCGDLCSDNGWTFNTDFYGILLEDGGMVSVTDATLSIRVDSVGNVAGQASFCFISDSLTMNHANVSMEIHDVSKAYRREFIGRKLLLNSGTISVSSKPILGPLVLSKRANISLIDGATTGAKTTDTKFYQKSFLKPLILSTKDPVNVNGFSMTKIEYLLGETVVCNSNPVVIDANTTNVTNSIDGYIYTYYKKDGENWADVGSQAPTEMGTYKLIVETADDVYYGKQELEPFTITSKHTMTFDTNGRGTAPAPIQNISYGEKISAPPAPSCDGYTFDGWYKDVSCNNRWRFKIDVVTGDATLYAKWTIKTYKISFIVSADGYGTVSQTSANALFETSIESSGNTLKIGDKTITATPSTDTAQYTYTFDGWTNVPTTVSSNATITANFIRTLNTYAVTFNANGHGTAPQSISDVAYGSKISEPTAPSCDGYTFGGWYKESGCQNVWTFSSDAVHGDTTLYAKWTSESDPTPEPTPTPDPKPEPKNNDEIIKFKLSTVKSSSNKAIKISWGEIEGATKYVVYGNKCGKDEKKLKTTNKTSYTFKKLNGKKLVAHKHYKLKIVAYTDDSKILSYTIHTILGNTRGKYANVKSIKPKYDELLLSVGVTQKLGATLKMYSGKKHIKKNHGKPLRYISNNVDVATVSSNGTVKAVGKGTATIYIQDIGGKYCKTKVTVE